METIARIRREHLSRGKSIKEIARDLKISRNTVRKILRSGETSFSYEREIQPRPKLGRWKAEIDWMLIKNADAPARERLTLIRLFEELVFSAHTRNDRQGQQRVDLIRSPSRRRTTGILRTPDGWS